jgi:hypothetical protein
MSLTRFFKGRAPATAGSVPTWKASLLKRSGRLVYMNSKLAASAIYHILSLDLPRWFFNTINKLFRGFFWSAAAEARKGHRVVAWDKVCTPKDLGGLEVKNLKLLNHTLRMLWRWMEMTETKKAWQGLKCTIAEEAEEVFLSCRGSRGGSGLTDG